MKKSEILILLFSVSVLVFTVSALFVISSQSRKSAIVGKWEDRGVGMIWIFNDDGSFREEPASGLWWNKKSKSGMYQVKGKKLILDTNKSGEHYEFTWYKTQRDYLTFGNEASGYWSCNRVQ